MEVSAGIAATVRELRLQRGLTQEALAEKASLHAKYLVRVEGGAANLTLASLVAIADALGVPVGELLRDKGPEVAGVG